MFNAKIVIGIIITTLLGVAYLTWQHDVKKINDLTISAAINKVASDSTVKVIAESKASEKVTEKVAIVIVKKVTEINTQQKINNEKIASSIKKVKKEYSLKPQTLDTKKELSDKTSAIMIDGLWDTYCLGMPDSNECLKQI